MKVLIVRRGKHRWTQEEDDAIRAAFKELGSYAAAARAVRALFPHRTAASIYTRAMKIK